MPFKSASIPSPVSKLVTTGMDDHSPRRSSEAQSSVQSNQQQWKKQKLSDQLQRQDKESVIEQDRIIPRYPNRANWKPEQQSDFGDGGAYPEIMLAQYPLNMGRKRKGLKRKGETLPVRIDTEGNMQLMYRGGADQQSVSQISSNSQNLQLSLNKTSLQDAKPLQSLTSVDAQQSLRRPTEEEAMAVAQRTQYAIEQRMQDRAKATNPSAVVKSQKDQFVKYTPAITDKQLGIKQRIVRIVEAPVDPLEPPRFRIKKRDMIRQEEDNAPVLHTPASVTWDAKSKEEQKQIRDQWNIPAAVSNWKNVGGQVISLEKRLAGQNLQKELQQVKVSDKFSKFSEALYIADKHARSEMELKADLQRKQQELDKAARQQHLSQVADRHTRNR
ncbi:hypothetical protein MIR68_011918 [Amoeboaphelidium protococcarum]|nr:hypothetical protein MIR68_011918 [Amoeboaphelidium protococcarum]